MAAPNTAKSNFRARGRKVTAPAFRPGIGVIYRELERTGKIPAEGIEKKAEYEEAKAAKEAARKKPKSGLSRLKSLVNGLFED